MLAGPTVAARLGRIIVASGVSIWRKSDSSKCFSSKARKNLLTTRMTRESLSQMLTSA